MNLKLPPLREEELRLLLMLLQTEFQGPPTELGRKAGLQAAPVEPIRRLAQALAAYARKNKSIYAVADSIAWTPDPDAVHVASGINKQEAIERLTREQWKRFHSELMQILKESHEIKRWGFRLPVVLPTKRVFVARPEDLVLNWLAARMIANRQQFRLVPACRRCGKAGLRERAQAKRLLQRRVQGETRC